ncbi:Dihydropteroate synthase [Daedalea quercina L-15889]|uniref:Dihydropteroate synthase n=1 Tax=Daedalea quercina L-15889 TaxID=1314783 RepID=A0A165KSE7_9APHY|nr:Dihydropteroate synthase [Daedalea quercina L-15889]
MGPTQQPILVTLDLAHDTRSTAATDDLSRSINYAAVSDTVIQAIPDSSSVPSLEVLIELVSRSCYERHPETQELSVGARIALSSGTIAGVEVNTARGLPCPVRRRAFIDHLECQAIVGVNPKEREVRQPILLDVILDTSPRSECPLDLQGLEAVIAESVSGSSFLTLEALASSVARIALAHCRDESPRLTVRVAKPHALRPVASAAEVEISRTLQDYEPEFLCKDVSSTVKNTPLASEAIGRSSFAKLLASVAQSDRVVAYPHRAAIALGANLGDRFANIELALRLLEMPPKGTSTPRAAVVDTSFMYETAPMYVADQPKFINCACIIETDLEPLELLRLVKEIEMTVGRVTSYRNGPRAIDLDILTYGSQVFDSRPASERTTLDNLAGQLVVPHPRIAEREFVLRPLNDMIPDFVHPTLGKSIGTLLLELVACSGLDATPMYKVTPFPRYGFPLNAPSRPPSPSLSDILPVPPTAAYWTHAVGLSKAKQRRTTYIMGTLNATPDSFSDGSKHNNIPSALAYTRLAVAGGASIVDVGGYSTRPRAAHVSPEEEISRVVPVIKAIRSIEQTARPADASLSLSSKTAHVLISVDTFRANVAAEAVHAGANCINDVYAFVGPEYPLTKSSAEHFLEMRRVARELAVPVVLMHSRGEASANKDYSHYAYAEDSNGRGAVLEGVRVELGERVEAAVKGRGGVRRWNVIVDPGVGFSKTVEDNLELVRDARKLTAHICRSGRNVLAGYPQLIGASRKSFLGTILARPDENGPHEGRETKASERSWATAAAVSCAVQQGVEVVRVHDVLELGDVVRISSALWGS